MVTSRTSDKVVIGRAEPLFLVGLLKSDLPAKVDSGAYRSAIHATDITVKDGQLSCTLLAGHPIYHEQAIPFTTSDFREVVVVNSFGHAEPRYQIKLEVTLRDQTILAQFTLANRAHNVFPILLGRKFLNGRFVIDTAKTSISRKELKELRDEFPKTQEEELA